MAEVGRPTEYKEEYIGEVDTYLADCQDEYDEFHKTRGDKSDSYERLIKVKMPTIEGFALKLGVNKTSLYEWEKEHEEFSNALEKIKDYQKQRLIEMGLSGEYNSTIAKLMLSANHGMREKSDVTTDDKPLTVTGFNYIKPNENNNPDNQAPAEATPSV